MRSLNVQWDSWLVKSEHSKLHWSIALTSKTHPTQRYCADWWSSLRTWWRDTTSAVTERRRHTTCLIIQQEEESGTNDSILEYSLEYWTRHQKQWLSPSTVRRSEHVRRTSGGFLSRTHGTQIEYSGYDRSRRPQTTLTTRSTFKSEWRDPLRWCFGRSFDGELSREDISLESRLRSVGSQWRVSLMLPEDWTRTTANSQRSMSKENWKPVERELVWVRTTACDYRTNRAVADAVERLEQGSSNERHGILKRVSVVCHPESEPQKKIASDTGHDSTPYPSISYTSCTTISTDQSTGTDDVDERSEYKTYAECDSSKQPRWHWWRCYDEGHSADENRAEHLSSSGSESRTRITTKREQREVRDAQTSVTEELVPRRIKRKTTLSEHKGCSYHLRGTGRIPREDLEGCECRAKRIELGVNLINTSPRHDAQWDISSGAMSLMSSSVLTKIGTWDARRKIKITRNSCASWTKRKRCAVAT